MYMMKQRKYSQKKILEIDVIYDLFTIGRKAFVGFSH